MKLNKIFNSNMVFAANKPIRIYGTGKGKASISFAGQLKTVISNEEEWLIEFPQMEYGGPYELVFDTESEQKILDDIYIGEVYLFAGQSNMQFKLKESSADASLYEDNDKLRLYSTDRIEKSDYYTPEDGWVKCKKEMAREWSAIGYFTGQDIVKSKDFAVGVIACYQGASVIESWVPKGAFEDNNIILPQNEKNIDHYFEAYSDFNKDGTLYSYAFSQVPPFSVSGVIWYQGESDTSIEEAKVYKDELSLMINIWRNDFCDDALPFVIVQIADFDDRKNDIGWKEIQKAQYEIQFALPNVKTVISRDVCESDDIHPPTKDKLSKRISEELKSFIK